MINSKNCKFMPIMVCIIMINFVFMQNISAQNTPAPAPADNNPRPQRESFLTPDVEQAIDKGLEALSKTQQEDGSFSEKVWKPGITAVVLLAFYTNGHSPDQGKYGKMIKRGLDFLLDKGQDKLTGYFGVNMYEHAFATMVLAEAYGESKREDLLPTLQKAVNVLVEAQNDEGGWRYQPIPEDADISVTGCVVQALRACREAFLNIPEKVIDRAVKYIRARFRAKENGFEYKMKQEGDQPHHDVVSWSRTGLGVLGLMACGQYDVSEVKKGLDFLLNHKGMPDEISWNSYGCYYVVQSLYQAGGLYWKNGYPVVQKQLIEAQQPDGLFKLKVREAMTYDMKGVSMDQMNTAFICTALGVQKGLLPLFIK